MKQLHSIAALCLISSLFLLGGCDNKAETAPTQKVPPLSTAATDNSKIIQHEPTVQSALYFKDGLALYQKFQLTEAIADYDKAIKADPENYMVYTAKGIALCFNGDYPQGMALIQKTLDMRADYVPAFYDMAMAYKLQHQYDQSLTWFHRVIVADEDNTWSYYGIATIYADQGNSDEALCYLRKAVALGGEDVKAAARTQDHFEQMRTMEPFQDLVR